MSATSLLLSFRAVFSLMHRSCAFPRNRSFEIVDTAHSAATFEFKLLHRGEQRQELRFEEQTRR
jgi:hypothetical protein